MGITAGQGTWTMPTTRRSEEYRERARELREAAKRSRFAEQRKELLYLAEQYEQLAQAADRRRNGGSDGADNPRENSPQIDC